MATINNKKQTAIPNGSRVVKHTPTPVEPNHTVEPSVFEYWLNSRKPGRHNLQLPPRPRVTGLERVYDIAHKSIVFTCMGISALLVAQLAYWTITKKGRKPLTETGSTGSVLMAVDSDNSQSDKGI